MNTVFPELAVTPEGRTCSLGSGMGVPPDDTAMGLPWVLTAKAAVRPGLVAPVGRQGQWGPFRPLHRDCPDSPSCLEGRLARWAQLGRQYMHNTENPAIMRIAHILKTIKQPL